MADKGRIKKELTELTRDTKSGVTIEVKSDDGNELEGAPLCLVRLWCVGSFADIQM